MSTYNSESLQKPLNEVIKEIIFMKMKTGFRYDVLTWSWRLSAGGHLR